MFECQSIRQINRHNVDHCDRDNTATTTAVTYPLSTTTTTIMIITTTHRKWLLYHPTMRQHRNIHRRRKLLSLSDTNIIAPTKFILIKVMIMIIALSSSLRYIHCFVADRYYLPSSSSSTTTSSLYLTKQSNIISSSPPTAPRTMTAAAVTNNAATTTTSTTTTTTAASRSHSSVLASSSSSSSSSWEDWCIVQLQLRYNEAVRIKCPFFRRRASDLLDAVDMILQFLLVRHKSLSIPLIIRDDLVTSRHTSSGINSGSSSYIQHSSTIGQSTDSTKLYNLSIEDLLSIIVEDWKVTNHKGYYVTGKLSTCIYQDDTIFDGPDPDMPVRGLYKYINAASQLFDTKHTYCELLSIEPEPEPEPSLSLPPLEIMRTNVNDDDVSGNTNFPVNVIVAKWKMHGRLRLPWKPVVPEWTGTTRYYIHPHTGLIYQHIETWDISVLQAFVQTLFPTAITECIYKE